MKISKGWVCGKLRNSGFGVFFTFNPRNDPSDWLAVGFLLGGQGEDHGRHSSSFWWGWGVVLWWWKIGVGDGGKCIVFFFPVWFTAFLRHPGFWSEFCLKKQWRSRKKTRFSYVLLVLWHSGSYEQFFENTCFILSTCIYQWKGMEIIKSSSYSK